MAILKTREKLSRWEKILHTGTILGNHTVNDGGLDAVNDIIACAGYEMTISANFYILLLQRSQHWGLRGTGTREARGRTFPAYSLANSSCLSSLSHARILIQNQPLGTSQVLGIISAKCVRVLKLCLMLANVADREWVK